MKKWMIAVVVPLFSATVWCMEVVWAGQPPKIEEREQERIKQGLKSGELTKEEASALQEQQKRLKKMRKTFWKDGYLSPRERHDMQEAQERYSRRIYRLKHNQGERK